MPFILEVAKAVIVDAIERDAQVEMVDFHPYAPRGFFMVVIATPSNFQAFSDALEGIDLEPDIRRIKRTPTVWHYETVVEVPEDWKAPQSRSAA